MSAARAQIDSLQVLRALAALAVMGFHGSGLLLDRAGYVLLGGFFAPGSAGVDLFFVLSGFIIYHSALRGTGAQRFAVKRFIRLFPVYWLVTALLIAAHLVAPSQAMAHKGEFSVIAASVLLWPAAQHVVGVAWTLVYEVWFYALFALLFFRSRGLFFAALAVWSAVGWSNALFWHVRPDSVALQYALKPVIFEFLLGCLAAVVLDRSRQLPVRWLVGVGTLGFAAAWLAHWRGELAVPWQLAFGFSSAALVLGAAASTVRMPRWLVYLGDASYSIYLLHATAISLVLRTVVQLDPRLLPADGLGAAMVLGTALMACVAFYQLVERPLLAACRRAWLAPREVAVPSRAASATAAG